MNRTFTINDLPANERPRERMQQHGPAALSVQELISVILGRGISGESVMVTGQRLLSVFGSVEGIAAASFEDLLNVKGLGPAKACQIQACFEIARRLKFSEDQKETRKKSMSITPPETAALVRDKITNYKKEHFVVLSFDTRNKLINIDTVFIGTINASIVHPREVFDIAIKRHAVWIIIAHNHPSGDIQPSDEDLHVTERLAEGGKLMGIEVMDHIIVTANGYYSFREKHIL